MALSISTTDNHKAHIMSGEGWQGGLGMVDTIKKQEKGIFTTPRTKVFETQDHLMDARERINMMGDDYGSAIVKDVARRGVDLMRDVDYIGQGPGGGTSGTANGVGLPLGKPLNLEKTPDGLQNLLKSNINGFTKDGVRSKANNVSTQDSNLNYAKFKQDKLLRPFTMNPVTNKLTARTVPTQVFLRNKTNVSGYTGSSQTDIQKAVIDNKINVPGNTRVNTITTTYKDNLQPFMRDPRKIQPHINRENRPLYKEKVVMEKQIPSMPRYEKTFDMKPVTTHSKNYNNKPNIMEQSEKLKEELIINKNIRNVGRESRRDEDYKNAIKNPVTVSSVRDIRNVKGLNYVNNKTVPVKSLRTELQVSDFLSSGSTTKR